MIDWTQSYGVDWRIVQVNEDTWASGEVVPNVSSVSVRKDCTDDCPLLETATLELTYSDEVFPPGWYRLECVFTQGGSKERHPIMTMLCESNSGKRDKKRIDLSVDGYSVLQPLKERHILAGDYVPKGMNGAEKAASYIRECTPAPVEVEGSFTIDEHVVLDTDISYIKAVWTVLDAADWCMQIRGDGTIVIKEKPYDPVLSLDRAHASILMPSIGFNRDVADIPNTYIAVENDIVATAVNDDPESITSTVYRGRIIDKIDRSPIRINGETLDAYARRMLERESTVVKTYSYDREWWPDVLPFDMVRGMIADAGLVADMRVMGQSFQCGNGLLVSESAGVVTKEYVA